MERILHWSALFEEHESRQIDKNLIKYSCNCLTTNVECFRYVFFLSFPFTAVCLVAKPFNRNEAMGDLVTIQTLLIPSQRLGNKVLNCKMAYWVNDFSDIWWVCHALWLKIPTCNDKLRWYVLQNVRARSLSRTHYCMQRHNQNTYA